MAAWAATTEAGITPSGSSVAAQARSLGTDPEVVFVPHPIQDRTDEVQALADAAVGRLLAALVDSTT